MQKLQEEKSDIDKITQDLKSMNVIKKKKEEALEELVDNVKLRGEVEEIRKKFPMMKLKKILLALSINENRLDKALEHLSKINPCKRKKIQKYKEMFPNDTEFDWEKFKNSKKERCHGMRGDQMKIRYKEMFPNDTDFDWEKFKKIKKEKKYKENFPNDTEFDWEKFKNLKKEGCRGYTNCWEQGRASGQGHGMWKRNHNNMDIKIEKYKEMFPNDIDFDWEKFRKIKKEKKYKEMFPNDTDFDWEKFKNSKKSQCKDSHKGHWKRKKEKYLIMFPNDTEFDWKKFMNAKTGGFKGKILVNRSQKYKEMFPNDTEFDWEKFRKIKKEMKYKEMFPNDTDFDWEKFRKIKKENRGCKGKIKMYARQWNELKEKKQQKVEEHLSKAIKEGTKTIYLDGNNMIFIESSIRNLCLNKKYSDACEKISELCYLYTSSLKLDTTLIFDNEKIVYEQQSDGVKFRVCSARPNYETSDDALVDWAGGLSASQLENSLFVSSDRYLLYRLIEKGVKNVMKSGVWWKLMKNNIGLIMYNDIISK